MFSIAFRTLVLVRICDRRIREVMTVWAQSMLKRRPSRQAVYSIAQTLPEEILDMVLEFLEHDDLASCTLVCRSWEWCSSRWYYHTLALTIPSSRAQLTSKMLSMLALVAISRRMRTHIRAIHIRGVTSARFHIVYMKLSLKYLPNVREVRLSNARLDSPGRSIATRLSTAITDKRSLDTLILAGMACDCFEHTLVDVVSEALLWFTTMKNLKIISFHICRRMQPPPLVHPSRRHSVKVGHLEISEQAIKESFAVLEVTLNPSFLEHLTIVASGLSPNVILINQTLRGFGSHLTHIDIEVHMYCFNDPTIQGGICFFECPQLRHVQITLSGYSIEGNMEQFGVSWRYYLTDLIPCLNMETLTLRIRENIYWVQEQDMIDEVLGSLDWQLLDRCAAGWAHFQKVDLRMRSYTGLFHDHHQKPVINSAGLSKLSPRLRSVISISTCDEMSITLDA